MDFRRLTDHAYVAPQIAPEDLDAAKAQGFDIIVSNRPDGEEPGLPTANDVAQKATELGLKFAHIPIVSGQFTPEAAGEMRKILKENKKVLAFCRSGTRSAGLWALASVGDIPSDQIIQATSEAGYDFSALAPHLRTAEGQL